MGAVEWSPTWPRQTASGHRGVRWAGRVPDRSTRPNLPEAIVIPGPGLLAIDPGELVAARSQMAFTLGFHIILACLGVGLPSLVLIANAIGLRRRDPVALLIARRWSLVMAVTFAVGAVTGTVLRFEMGLLWPVLMGRFCGGVGVPFATRGLFFFLAASLLPLYI